MFKKSKKHPESPMDYNEPESVPAYRHDDESIRINIAQQIIAHLNLAADPESPNTVESTLADPSRDSNNSSA